MTRRALVALLLLLLVTPIPALCQACVDGDCPERRTAAHGPGHDDMHHGEIRHERTPAAPACHPTEPMPEPGTTDTMESALPDCCTVAEAASLAPAVRTKGFDAGSSVQVVQATAVRSQAFRSESRLEVREAPPPRAAPPLYTLHSALLI